MKKKNNNKDEAIGLNRTKTAIRGVRSRGFSDPSERSQGVSDDEKLKIEYCSL